MTPDRDVSSGLCRDVFGPEGRLIEIQSAEDQELAVQVMKAAEGMFGGELPSWWSALRDDDDDGLWVWFGSNTSLTYSAWHPNAVPDHQQFNCMQFLSGTAYEGEGRRETAPSPLILLK